MKIQLKKGRDGPATLVCVRDDGSRTWGREHPFFPLHDLTHYAVECVLGFEHAFLGLIAAGWAIDDFAKPGAASRLPAQAIVAEHIVGVLDRERALPQPLSADQFNENVSASVRSLKDVPFQPVNASQLAEVHALRDRLQAQWHALPLGATLEVAWQHPSLDRAQKLA